MTDIGTHMSNIKFRIVRTSTDSHEQERSYLMSHNKTGLFMFIKAVVNELLLKPGLFSSQAYIHASAWQSPGMMQWSVNTQGVYGGTLAVMPLHNNAVKQMMF